MLAHDEYSAGNLVTGVDLKETNVQGTIQQIQLCS